MRNLFRTFLRWLPFAATISAFAFLSYAVVQQNYRQGANAPQVELARDIAADIDAGRAVALPEYGIRPDVDMAKSLSPFVMLFDSDGIPTTSSGTIAGTVPSVPSGVISYTRTRGEDRFTWEPKPGVRIAAVAERVGKQGAGFVLAGRSLAEIERLEKQTFIMAAGVWAIALAAVFVILLITGPLLELRKA